MNGYSELKPFDRSFQHAQEWIKDVMDAMKSEQPEDASRALHAVLPALRDRLPTIEGAHLAAQLPLLLRGMFYEQWRPSDTPTKERTLGAFMHKVGAHLPTDQIDPEAATRAVFTALDRRVTPGEVEKVRRALPGELRELWTAEARA